MFVLGHPAYTDNGVYLQDSIIFETYRIHVKPIGASKSVSQTRLIQLPMRAIRTMAGFESAEGMYHNICTAVEPPQEALEMIFPWLEQKMEEVDTKCEEDGVDRWTAIMFLRLMKRCRRVVLQDAAAIWVLHPERRTHYLFGLSLFQSELFLVRNWRKNETENII